MTIQTTTPAPADDRLLAVRRLYEQNFRADELLDWDEQVERIATGVDELLVASGPTDAVSGFAIANPLDSRDTLLAYLAVDAAARGHGTGRTLLDRAVASARHRGGRWLLIEVDSPEVEPHPLVGDPRRRISFYASAGAVVLTEKYGYPNFDDSPGWCPMWLLGIALRPQDVMTPADLRGVIADLWGPSGYGRDPDDADLARLLASL